MHRWPMLSATPASAVLLLSHAAPCILPCSPETPASQFYPAFHPQGLLSFYLDFPVNDHTGEALSEDNITSAHYQRVCQLQRLLFKHWPQVCHCAHLACTVLVGGKCFHLHGKWLPCIQQAELLGELMADGCALHPWHACIAPPYQHCIYCFLACTLAPSLECPRSLCSCVICRSQTVVRQKSARLWSWHWRT